MIRADERGRLLLPIKPAVQAGGWRCSQCDWKVQFSIPLEGVGEWRKVLQAFDDHRCIDWIKPLAH